MLDTISILKKAADKAGFNRVRFEDQQVPTSIANICIMTLFGDMRSTFVASSILLRRYREEQKGSKYFILCGWPGYENMFPYVDEYWSIKLDEAAIQKVWSESDGLANNSIILMDCERHLNYFFEERLNWEELNRYYRNGLQQEFFDKFRHVKVYLPTIPSSVVLKESFLREVIRNPLLKVFLYPSLFVNGWRNGKVRKVKASKGFWLHLIDKLVSKGIYPVVYKDSFAHDLSADVEQGKCYFLSEGNISLVMSAMRATGCVLDVFQGLSRLAIAARSPFLMCEERAKYNGLKEYEIDDLCIKKLPKEYIFGFSTILEHEDKLAWDANLFDNIVVRLNSMLPKLDRDAWPSTNETYEIISYENVRKIKTKKLGTRLFRVTQD